VPRQDSTGGNVRRILVVGAHAVLRYAMQHPEKYPWLTQLLARRPFKVVAGALANKMARMAWALLAHGGTYRAPQIAEAA
jgi:transposase